MNFLHGQILQSSLYALWWGAKIVSGEYRLRHMQQGREPTPEERANGQTIGWRDKDDDEKLADAVDTMKRHCDRVADLVQKLPPSA